jgi:hypothetical protein
MLKFSDLEFKQHPCVDGPNAAQALHFFPNGYGVSVVRFPGSYGYGLGLYEVAVIKGTDEEDFKLCYDTPITDGVIGRLTWDEVEGILAQIQELAVATQEV